MNDNQKRLCVVVVVVIVAMAVYPPFQLHRYGRTASGYGWIFSPPFSGAGTIDVGMLLAQWAIVVGIGIIGFFLLKNRS